MVRSAHGRPGPTIQIPRWIQLVVLPVLLVLAFLLARSLGHVLFLFLTASGDRVHAQPLVRDLTRLKVPRAVGVHRLHDLRGGRDRAPHRDRRGRVRPGARTLRTASTSTSPTSSAGQTAAEVDIDRLQAWLDDHGLEDIQVREQINEWLDSLSAGEISGYAQDAIAFAQGAAFSFVLLLFSVILIVVISIYMLLDMQRLERSIDSRFPPHGGRR